jgi:cell pole-organizing protein PopZ
MTRTAGAGIMAEGRNEPSMDEILSSIKRIIADDERIRPLAKRAPKAAPVRDDQDEILELTEAAADDDADDVLLDDSKAQSLRHSFSALQTLSEPGVAPQIVRSGETSLEGLTRDLLRPMLKDWLDNNLPPIVEAMVEREITRITKKG